jgi:hypothetical protein
MYNNKKYFYFPNQEFILRDGIVSASKGKTSCLASMRPLVQTPVPPVPTKMNLHKAYSLAEYLLP